MEFLFEILLEFVGELLLQVFAEALFEIGLHSLAAPFKKKLNPYLATIGYVLFGAIAGGLSLWAFPSLFIGSHLGRIANVGRYAVRCRRLHGGRRRLAPSS